MSTSSVDWTVPFGASRFDVVRGELGLLGSTRGDFSQAVQECVGSDVLGDTVPYIAEPAAGEGFWFLVRGIDCPCACSYDSAGAGQFAPRDVGIAASPASCP